MNPWDIDPNLYLPVFRTICRSLYGALQLSLQKPFRQRHTRVIPPRAGCRG